jgi:HAD superfamily hydrolase (TIGR01549 family)
MSNPVIDAVIFDYGNTLVRFDREEVHAYDRALATVLEREMGPFDFDTLRTVRDADRHRPYEGDPPPYIENDMRVITANLLETLYGRTPGWEEVDAIVAVRREEFVKLLRTEAAVRKLLDELCGPYRLALLSNYPDGQAIRESLAHEGLADAFEAVVVSGEVGRVKPHPEPFRAVLEAMGVEPARAVYVGDNWRADVQGSKGVGMKSVYYTKWQSPENLPKREGDFTPDVEITDLADLPKVLLEF